MKTIQNESSMKEKKRLRDEVRSMYMERNGLQNERKAK